MEDPIIASAVKQGVANLVDAGLRTPDQRSFKHVLSNLYPSKCHELWLYCSRNLQRPRHFLHVLGYSTKMC